MIPVKSLHKPVLIKKHFIFIMIFLNFFMMFIISIF